MSRAPSALVVRAAREEDAEAVMALLAASDLPLAGVAEWLPRFAVADLDGELVGVAGLEVHGRDGLLRSVAVAEATRGQGIGSRLTSHVIAAARRAGLGRLYLLTEGASGYFAKRGFTTIPREAASTDVQESVEFREACSVSATLMALDLEG